MHIIAIHNLPDNKDTLAAKLAVAMTSTLYETHSRLRTPGKGPLVVGVYADIRHAKELLIKLRDDGFGAILLKSDEIETETAQFVVKKFSLGSNALFVKSGSGESLTIDYCSIGLIVRGTSVAQTTATETVKERKFAPGMAILTGGLKMTNTTERVIESTTHAREGFFLLYSGNQKTLVFREGGLNYASLGISLHPTRQGNFSFLLKELRRHGTEALYDDRLLSRAGQTQLLGLSLNPEEHLAVATTLLAKVLR